MTVSEFNECVDKYSDQVYRFILKHCGDTDNAKDILQETFEKLWIKVSDEPARNAKSYLFTSAHHTLIDWYRRNKKTVQMDAEVMDLNSFQKPQGSLKMILDEGLALLPEIQRTVILLRDYEGYAYDEIGGMTGLNESQVKVYIYRARVFLKNYIGSMDLVV